MSDRSVDEMIGAGDWRGLRAAAGLSQVAWAKKLGASRRSVQLWENTTRWPHPMFIKAMRSIAMRATK